MTAHKSVATFGDYGSVEYQLTVNEHGGATSRITRADDRIGISAELVERGEIETAGDGLLSLDHSGDYLYRKIGTDLNGRVVVCERVR